MAAAVGDRDTQPLLVLLAQEVSPLSGSWVFPCVERVRKRRDPTCAVTFPHTWTVPAAGGAPGTPVLLIFGGAPTVWSVRRFYSPAVLSGSFLKEPLAGEGSVLHWEKAEGKAGVSAFGPWGSAHLPKITPGWRTVRREGGSSTLLVSRV